MTESDSQQITGDPTGHIAAMLVKTLEDSTLFKKVSPEMVRELAAKMKISSHDPGETIIRKDDEGIHMFFIISGEVKIHDREHLLARLGKGEFFGEMSILDREPRSMSVTALAPTVTGSIIRSELFEVITRFPGMTVELIGFLSRRLRKLNKFMVEQLKNREKELEKQVEERTAALARKNAELEEAIIKLKESQQQLIMQEKLASLGRLTAGVAHELHNPLNFVNNFTELSLDLLNEIQSSDSISDAEPSIELIRQNLEKTLRHGERAEIIIKSMITHSNSGPGKVIASDLNEIFEQSVNIVSYSAANNAPGCQVRIEKNYMAGLPMVSVNPRDISKVLINLLNNAFYEVNKRWNKEGDQYEPRILLFTSVRNNKIALEIIDNGYGILPDYLDQVFEPFFTTKPTGEGVGLGLSISNDIARAHGGVVHQDTTPENYTRFTLLLPVNN
jgi:histidine kinase